MSTGTLVPAVLFIFLAVLFLGLAARRPNPTPARRAHVRIGLIFAAVAAWLYFVQPHLR